MVQIECNQLWHYNHHYPNMRETKKGKQINDNLHTERKKEIQMIDSQLDGWIRTDGQTERWTGTQTDKPRNTQIA